jgi:hypothetical protein
VASKAALQWIKWRLVKFVMPRSLEFSALYKLYTKYAAFAGFSTSEQAFVKIKQNWV